MCVFLSFPYTPGRGGDTCRVEKFARVQRAFRAEASEKTDAPGHSGGQGWDAARRLQGEDTL